MAQLVSGHADLLAEYEVPRSAARDLLAAARQVERVKLEGNAARARLTAVTASLAEQLVIARAAIDMLTGMIAGHAGVENRGLLRDWISAIRVRRVPGRRARPIAPSV
jgi:hypothetical protein